MKIAQVTKYFHPHIGGIESNVLGVSEELIKRGNDVTIFTSNVPRTRSFESICGIKVFRSLSFFTFSKDPFSPGILINLLRKDYDLIHLHLPDPFNSILVWLASKIKRKPFIVTYHADIMREGSIYGTLNRIYSLFLKIVLKDSDKILATSPAYVKGSETLGRFNEKIEIVPNFVDIEKFNPDMDRLECIKRLSLEEIKDKRVILFLGRLVPYKGVEYLIKAFPQVRERVEKAFLLIVGEGPLRENLEKMASGMDDVKIMKMHGENDDSSLYYPICEIFVLPSITRQEAFGISLLEAMACGKPCITTNISGMPYVVGKTGVRVNPRDPEGLSCAMIELLSEPERLKELGRKAMKRVEKEFSRGRVTEMLLSVYDDALK
jgi:glycosyltransferase involved in cell wall biosynthesis